MAEFIKWQLQPEKSNTVANINRSCNNQISANIRNTENVKIDPHDDLASTDLNLASKHFLQHSNNLQGNDSLERKMHMSRHNSNQTYRSSVTSYLYENDENESISESASDLMNLDFAYNNNRNPQAQSFAAKITGFHSGYDLENALQIESQMNNIPMLMSDNYAFNLVASSGQHMFSRNSFTQDFGAQNGMQNGEMDEQIQPDYAAQGFMNSAIHNASLQNFNALNNYSLNVNFVFDAEFSNIHLWKPEYQRNNRNGGMKNIRCFPYCGPKHYSSGFCGESLILKVRTNTNADQIFAYAEITLSDDGNSLSLTGSNQQGFINTVEVGTCLSRFEICEKLRSRDNPFKDWWSGELRETKEIIKRSRANNASPGPPDMLKRSNSDDAVCVERQLAFEFNRAKRGWHYGWVANKYISDSQHCVRAYIFVPTSPTSDALKCVHVAKSPGFRLYSRKPKRDHPYPCQHDSEKTLFSSRRESKKMKRRSTRELKEENGFCEPSLPNVIKRIEEISEEHGLAEKFDSQTVLKFMQKLLSFSQDDTTGTNDFNGISEKDLNENELKALRAFASFILSDEEDFTTEIQSKIDHLDALDSKRRKKSLKSKTKDLVKLARSRFDKFLSSFNLNIDFFAKRANSENQVVPSGRMTKFEEHILKTAEALRRADSDMSDKNLVENLDQVNKILLTSPFSCVKSDDDGKVRAFLEKFEGVWFSSSDTLAAYDRMYAFMKIPYALRKCYQCITGSFKVELVQPGEDSKIPSLTFHYNPKLFSTGVLTYKFDGTTYPWPLASPLISTHYDAVAYRSFIKDCASSEAQSTCSGTLADVCSFKAVVEHVYRGFKMVRAFYWKTDDFEFNFLTGVVTLFEKSFDVENNIEWTEIDRSLMSFARK